MQPSRRWGDDRAILDDEEARRRILDAAGRCIVRRGNTQFRMGEVSDEAGVSRSTVYRYFPGRDDVLLGLMLMRVDTAPEFSRRVVHNSTKVPARCVG